MRLFNLLTAEQSMILQTLQGWVVREIDDVTEEVSETVDVTAVASVRHYRKTPGSLRLEINSIQPGKSIELRTIDDHPLPGVTISPSTNYRAFAWVKPDSRLMLHLQLCFYDSFGNLLGDPFESSDLHFLGEHRDWHFVSVEGRAPASATKAQVCIRIPNEMIDTPAVLYVDDVVLTPYTVPWDPFFLLCARHVPEYMRFADLEQTEPTQPLFRYMGVAVADAERIFKAATAFDRAPASDRVKPIYQNSTLVDPSAYPQTDVAEARWLPWLAQVTGAMNVNVNSVGLTTTWSTLEKNLASWLEVETLVDPGSLDFSFSNSTLLFIERLSNVVSATLSDVSDISVGQSVTASGDGEWAGVFTVTSIDGNQVSWDHSGDETDAESGPLVLSFSDTQWFELESAFPDSFDTTAVLAHLIRSGGTGLWAGTLEGMRRAVRSVLSGTEVDATLIRDGDGGLSVVFDEPMSVASDQLLDVYLCDDATFDGQIVVSGVASDGLSITAAQDGPAGTQRAVVSQRIVEVEIEDPVGDPYLVTLRTFGSLSPDESVLLAAANLAKPAGWTVEYVSLS